ncbi:DUF3344 domain-containing protein [Methanofollis ethanolicus]|uniref:DUF3344 domain-containing protein n=1 Tax=Methanofollis ethanolicus TaxID=488124 RepID=UPI0008359FD6|nr:DUF3344 domain-containing protein [Methanofollis ethanolicus]
MLTGMLVALLLMAAPAAADPYIGGDKLVTANGTSGTVSGGLWFDAYPGFDYAYTTPVTKDFSLPCTSANVAWARLYVATYIGSMTSNYPLNTTVEFDGGSGYSTLGSEIMNTTYTYPAGSGADGTVWINGHCNRVTSDCLMWYDVTNSITSSSVAARVHTAKPDGTQPNDGRVKMIALVVAYNGGSDTIHYWVNQGHDTDSYKADDYDCSYIGNTTFSTSGLAVDNANLTAIYLGSYNGNYTFNGNALPWSNPCQGSYFGHQSWDVTNYATGGNSFMTFDRNTTHSGSYSGYFKIPLALLTVKEE